MQKEKRDGGGRSGGVKSEDVRTCVNTSASQRNTSDAVCVGNVCSNADKIFDLKYWNMTLALATATAAAAVDISAFMYVLHVFVCSLVENKQKPPNARCWEGEIASSKRWERG